MSFIDLNELNSPQREAVLHTTGPLAIYAGAGSGKTKTICCRIAYLIENGVPPSSILAVTFTNKAAKEMRERVESIVGYQSRSVQVSTFHSACARFLRLFAEEAGYQQNFSIYDDDEQKSLIKDVLSELEIRETQLSIPILKSRIDSLKNQGKTVKIYENELNAKEKSATKDSWHDYPVIRKFGESVQERLVLEGYKRYQEKLTKQNAMDFNDLLLIMTDLIAEKDSVRKALQNRFRYFLVDEFQDTNPIQFKFISTLSNHTNNLCIVGDDDQSIYSWRGADPSFILNFGKLYPDAKIIKLEQNYRSFGTIVKAATEVIAHNVTRTPKKLWTSAAEGEPIVVKPCNDAIEESQFVLSRILDKIKLGHHFGSFGILYRTNAQSRIIEDALRRRMLPYVIYGSVRFYERAEIKNLICYLRTLVNPQDDAAFQRSVNTPKRGFGEKALLTLKKAAAENGLSLYETAKSWSFNQLALDLGRGSAALKNLIDQFQDWTQDLTANIPLGDLLQKIIGKIDYQAYVRNQYPEDSDERWQNVIELRNALTEFSQNLFESEKTTASKDILSRFIEDASLIVEPNFKNTQAGNADAISLMTIHAAKGLEFKTVFIVGMEEGTLPHMNSLESNKDIEEERRLFYVALTRAREELFITHVKRHRYKPDTPCIKSRFLSEIPSEYIETSSAHSGAISGSLYSYRGISNKGNTSPLFSANSLLNQRPDGALAAGDSSQENNPWRSGTRVKHKVFGTGIVQSAEKSLDGGYRVEVRFPALGVKKLLHTYLSLEG